MSMFTPHTRGKSWLIQITVLCVILGVLLALSLKSEKPETGMSLNSRAATGMPAAYRLLKENNEALAKELQEAKAEVERRAKEQAEGVSSSKHLESALGQAKLFAGTVDARGPGVVVTLRDSPKEPQGEGREDIAVLEHYLVHDYDIRTIVNELFAAGAEAVSVNEQRITSVSSIRCVGPLILLNSVKIGPPFIIKAIGDPDSLNSALTMTGGVADSLILLDMFEVEKADDIVVPAYNGTTKFKYAKPVENKETDNES